MKTGIQVLGVLVLLFCAACAGNEFEIKGELAKGVTRTVRLTYYGSDRRGGVQIETALAVTAGKGELKCITREPVVGMFYGTTSDVPSAFFYAERGDVVKITGETADVFDWEIGGNRTNRALSDWRKANRKEIYEAQRPLGEEALQEARRKLNGRIAEYVRKEDGGRVAAILLYGWYDSNLDRKEFEALDSIVSRGTGGEIREIMARHDLYGANAGKIAGVKVSDMVVQSYLKNIDTLRFGSGGKRVFLYIWTRDDADFEAYMDSLRRMAKSRKDSAAYTIADMNVGLDSISWCYRVREDSVRHTVRARAVRGLAEPGLSEMGVRGTPWIVIGDGKGKVVYSGREWRGI